MPLEHSQPWHPLYLCLSEGFPDSSAVSDALLLPDLWNSQTEVKTVELEVTSKMSQSSGLTEQMEKRRTGGEVGLEDL